VLFDIAVNGLDVSIKLHSLTRAEFAQVTFEILSVWMNGFEVVAKVALGTGGVVTMLALEFLKMNRVHVHLQPLIGCLRILHCPLNILFDIVDDNNNNIDNETVSKNRTYGRISICFKAELSPISISIFP
jgi:hypothetical protein